MLLENVLQWGRNAIREWDYWDLNAIRECKHEGRECY